ncbi:unnamed protein product [Rhizophagus irregularis]|nr:unnamed protein product [Rhizophagus irregularis]
MVHEDYSTNCTNLPYIYDSIDSGLSNYKSVYKSVKCYTTSDMISLVIPRRTWTWTSERLGRLEFRKGTPAWNSISAWAIKETPSRIWIS